MSKKSKLNPEVICLSDDEEKKTAIINDKVNSEEKEKPSDKINENSQMNSSDASNWIIDEKDLIRIPDVSSRYSDIYKKPFEIRCSTIRFGVVEFNVDGEVILMKNLEFEMKLRSGFQENVNMKLAYSDLITFYFSFQSQTPAAFIQVRKEFADLFSRYIPSSDEQGRSFDPNSKDIKRRRIVFCLKSLTPDMEKIHIATIFHSLKEKSPKLDIRCINGSRAQELYNLTRYAKLPAVPVVKTPFSLTTKDLTAKTVGLNKNTIRFDLSHDDLFGLNEGQYLNDNIIDFYLQYIYQEKLNENDRQRTYLFNSFFYTRLTKKGNDGNSTISASERRYNRVKRWLRDVDIFSKDYLIVPINQTAHWYVVIIQYPNRVLTKGEFLTDIDNESLENRSKLKKKRVSERIQLKNDRKLSSESSKSIFHAIDLLSEVDEAPSDNEIDSDASSDSLKSGRNDSESPSIILFDSLRTHSKTRVAATLREFLQHEYNQKKSSSTGSSSQKFFTRETIPTIDAAVPQQLNFSDCGLYILQYVENFFAHRCSTSNFHLSSTFSTWCEQSSMGSSKRQEILNVINQHQIIKDV